MGALESVLKETRLHPNILLVMIRTLEFSGISYKNLRLKSADLYMYPDVLRFTRTDFHLAEGIANAGYDCARKNLLQWLSNPDARARRPDLAGAVFEGAKGPSQPVPVS